MQSNLLKLGLYELIPVKLSYHDAVKLVNKHYLRSPLEKIYKWSLSTIWSFFSSCICFQVVFVNRL